MDSTPRSPMSLLLPLNPSVIAMHQDMSDLTTAELRAEYQELLRIPFGTDLHRAARTRRRVILTILRERGEW